MQTVWTYFKLCFGALLIVVTVGPLVLPESEHLKRYANLEHEGQTIDAIVTDKIVSEKAESSVPTTPLYMLGPAGRFAGGFVDGSKLGRAMSGESSNPEPSSFKYYVEYKFQAPNHQVIKRKKRLSLAQYNTVAVGSKLAALYHPQSPRIHRLIGYSRPFRKIDPMMQFWVALIFGGLGALLVWRNWPFNAAMPARPSAENGLSRVAGLQPATSYGQMPSGPARPSYGKPANRSGFGKRG